MITDKYEQMRGDIEIMDNKTPNVRVTIAAFLAVVVFLVISKFVTTPESVQQSFWSLIPPLIAIILALVTKEVYSSLFIGIVTGSLLFAGFNFEGTMTHIFNDGIIASLSDSWNVGILIFLDRRQRGFRQLGLQAYPDPRGRPAGYHRTRRPDLHR